MKLDPPPRFDSVYFNNHPDRMEVNKMDNELKLTPVEIGDALNLENEAIYPCSDGSETSTISVDALLDKQVALTKAHYEAEGYIKLPEGAEAIRAEEWLDIPDRRGSYWMSSFCDGKYISPRIISVIDYERPDRGLEVQDDFPHDTIPVKVFCKEYYPKAKWLYIKIPEWQILSLIRQEKE